MEEPSRNKIRKLEHAEEDPEIPVDLAVEKTMGIPLIADEILKLLPTADLLSCSLVNLQWNSASRSVLRKHRICLASISETNPCASIKNLNELLENSPTPPFNGLAISTEIPFRHKCSFQSSGEDTPQLLTNLLSKIYLKNLKVSWSEHTNCLAVSLIKKIFQYYPSTIEHLCLDKLPLTIPCLSKYFGYSADNRHEWFPNLKTLQVKPTLKHQRTDILEDVLASAPNLQELVGSVCPKNVDLILKHNKFPTIKHFDLVNLHKLEDTSVLVNFLRMQPSHLKKLTISGVRFLTEEALPNWLSTLESLWKCCSLSLDELEINHLDLIVLSTAGFPALPHVSTVTVTFDICVVKRDGQPKLRCINFPRMFPNLKVVKVHPDFDEPHKGRDMIPSRGDRQDPSLHWTVVLSMAKIFPTVKHFTVRGCPEVAYFCEALWTAWKDLESICFTSVKCSSSFHIDPCIIGISEPEWKYWKDIKEDLNFDKLQFAPVRSSLRNCSKLKKLRLEFTHRKDSCRPFQLTLLTELSGACAFSRIPNLQVEIVRSKCSAEYNFNGILDRIPCCFALDTLAPYVSLKYKPTMSDDQGSDQRLPGFQGPRDLKLSLPPARVAAQNRRTFAPNIPSGRSRAAAKAESSKPESSKAEGSSERGRRGRGGFKPNVRGGKRESNLLQTQGVFQDGVGSASTSKHRAPIASASSGVSRKISSLVESGGAGLKQEIKSERKDSYLPFISDGGTYDEFLDPVTVPLSSYTPPTFEGHTEEDIELSRALSFAKKVMEVPEDGMVVLLQLPEQLPLMLDKDEVKDVMLCPDLTNFPEGLAGSTQILSNGFSKLSIGDNQFNLEAGTDPPFYQELVLATEDSIISLGPIRHKFLCTPDVDSFLNQS
ncbi:unnamed protein product [Allacma fusca]|uniref:F-box domain-containing protein n=1 Tax=Allacma fusca TaxID=39272 RepID=A0A8J2MGH5_9HEXA|nr:unnamed protein product [Allacma fusca]